MAYVIGGGGHAKVVVRTLQDLGIAIDAVFDDDAEKLGTSMFGVPVVGPVAELGRRERAPAILAVGDNDTRRRLAEMLDLPWLSPVHPSAFVDSTARLGEGTVVFAGAIVQPDTVIGRHAIINTSASVDHDCVLGDYVHIGPGAQIAGGVHLGDGVFIGAGSVVIPGKRIGEWTVVGAGGVVVTDLPSGVVAVGVPAKPRH